MSIGLVVGLVVGGLEQLEHRLADIEHHIVEHIELVGFVGIGTLGCIGFGRCCIGRCFRRSEYWYLCMADRLVQWFAVVRLLDKLEWLLAVDSCCSGCWQLVGSCFVVVVVVGS